MALSQVQQVLLFVSLFSLGALARDFEYCHGDADEYYDNPEDYYANVTSVEVFQSKIPDFFTISLNATATKTITAEFIRLACSSGEAIRIPERFLVMCELISCNIEAGTKLQYTFEDNLYMVGLTCKIYMEKAGSYAPSQLCVKVEVDSPPKA